MYFYDAVENIEDLCSLSNGDDEECRRHRSADPQLSRLQSRLVVICQRKANVRNRKVLRDYIVMSLLFCVELMSQLIFVVLHCDSKNVRKCSTVGSLSSSSYMFKVA